MMVMVGWLALSLCCASYLFGSAISQKVPKLSFTQPQNGQVYTANVVHMGARADNFDVGLDGVACFEVLWDKGDQIFCAPSLTEDFVLGGLETGSYAVVGTLRAGGARGPVVAEDFRTFAVALARPDPRVKITHPLRDSVITSSPVEIFFVVSYADNDIVVCLSANDFKIGRTCFENDRHYWTIKPDRPGRVRVSAQLFHRNGTEVAAPQARAAVEFDVRPPPPPPRGRPGEEEEEEEDEDDGRAAEERVVVPTGELQVDETPPSTLGIDIHRGVLKDWQKNQVHMAVISARSEDRYEEALVMIKSALFHWGKSTAEKYSALHIHMIVDTAAQDFFKKKLVSQNLPRVEVSFYSFHSTCSVPVDEFLEQYNLHISAHYSGRAGYCRLFLPSIFLDLNAIMAVESDQLFFDDPGLLWEQFLNFPADAMVGAPELYQPWQESRPYADHSNQSGSQQEIILEIDGTATRTEQIPFNLDAENHGFGMIGGIILLDLKKMRQKQWQMTWHQNFRQFLENQGKGWSPTLNDQDVFNAVFSVSPQLLHILPCEWNLQYHAYMNSIRLCGPESLNCEAALHQNVYVCPRHPKIVHFMAGSYNASPQFYNSFWKVYKDMPFFLIKESLSHDSRKYMSTIV